MKFYSTYFLIIVLWGFQQSLFFGEALSNTRKNPPSSKLSRTFFFKRKNDVRGLYIPPSDLALDELERALVYFAINKDFGVENFKEILRLAEKISSANPNHHAGSIIPNQIPMEIAINLRDLFLKFVFSLVDSIDNYKNVKYIFRSQFSGFKVNVEKFVDDEGTEKGYGLSFYSKEIESALAERLNKERSLRNSSLLWEVAPLRNGELNVNLSSLLHPLSLSNQELREIVTNSSSSADENSNGVRVKINNFPVRISVGYRRDGKRLPVNSDCRDLIISSQFPLENVGSREAIFYVRFRPNTKNASRGFFDKNDQVKLSEIVNSLRN